MKSYNDWRLLAENALPANSDLAWDQVKKWASGKNLDSKLVNDIKLKIEGIKEWYTRELNNKKVKDWSGVPAHMRDIVAKSIVTATIQAFYSEMPSSGQTQIQSPNIVAPQQQPQKELNAPGGWKG